MDKNDMKIMFITALMDAFKDEEDRELDSFPEIDINNVDCNEMVLAMFYAFQFVFNHFTTKCVDPLEFIEILIRLLFQDQEKRLKNNES